MVLQLLEEKLSTLVMAYRWWERWFIADGMNAVSAYNQFKGARG